MGDNGLRELTCEGATMTPFICVTCGVQYTPSEQPPEHCLICEDERQYIGLNGQQWTTAAELGASHSNVLFEIEPNLLGIGITPSFAIGQRALLVKTPEGNILWDCVPLLDDTTRAAVAAQGGIAAIACSHPHMYAAMVEWSHAFDAPIYLSAADREWAMRPDPMIQWWEGDTQAMPGGTTMIRCGGHFPGSSVLHWPVGADGRGAILTGDTIFVVSDRRYVTFMYSYPNSIPLDPAAVRHIVDAVQPYRFDRIYSAFERGVCASDGAAAVTRSAERYIAALQGQH